MKAISLWQPWASLIACGAKRIETRSRITNYRGELAIHAAKTTEPWIDELINESPFRESLEDAISGLSVYAGNRLLSVAAQRKLPLGVIVATCRLVECRKIADPDGYTPKVSAEGRVLGAVPFYVNDTERIFGDFTPGCYAWIVTDIKPLAEPILAKGKPGLWEWIPPAGFEVSR